MVTYKRNIVGMLSILVCLSMAITPALAAQPSKANIIKSSYTENEFLDAFSGKSRKVVTEILGIPVKKEQSVKPSNADGITAQVGRANQSKPVSVEMWYYQNLVKYNAKKTYKSVELTFVNDRCMNIAFFNDR
ncbi:MAG: hypothetical protein ABL885_14635 [Methylophilaceae bacterium]